MNRYQQHATLCIEKCQFEHHGYFLTDQVDHVQGSKPVFNLAVELKDSWGKVDPN